MKYLYFYWLAVLTVISIIIMFEVINWTDRIVKQTRMNANQQSSISILEEATKINQEAIIGKLQFDLEAVESDPDYATGKAPIIPNIFSK